MPLWKPGDLNVFFETIVDNANGNGEYYRQFNPKALSRPKTKSDGSDGGVENDGAWLVLLDNCITDEEAERIIEIGHGQGFERSRKAVHSGEGRVTEGEHHLIHGVTIHA
jgi:prolyl 4-hydroxylase